MSDFTSIPGKRIEFRVVSGQVLELFGVIRREDSCVCMLWGLEPAGVESVTTLCDDGRDVLSSHTKPGLQTV